MSPVEVISNHLLNHVQPSCTMTNFILEKIWNFDRLKIPDVHVILNNIIIYNNPEGHIALSDGASTHRGFLKILYPHLYSMN